VKRKTEQPVGLLCAANLRQSLQKTTPTPTTSAASAILKAEKFDNLFHLCHFKTTQLSFLKKEATRRAYCFENQTLVIKKRRP
jgi:hypothetical protein